MELVYFQEVLPGACNLEIGCLGLGYVGLWRCEAPSQADISLLDNIQSLYHNGCQKEQLYHNGCQKEK